MLYNQAMLKLLRLGCNNRFISHTTPFTSGMICNRLILSSALLMFSSCSSFDLLPSDSLIQRVKGRGPVLVSTDNPYLAANLLLQQEAKKSKELAGFLTQVGQPEAIEVDQKLMESAKISLYYKENSQQYNMELLRGIWVIDGPYPIKDSNVIDLLKVQPSSALLATEKSEKIITAEKLPLKTQPDQSAKHQLVPKEAIDLNSADSTEMEEFSASEPTASVESTSIESAAIKEDLGASTETNNSELSSSMPETQDSNADLTGRALAETQDSDVALAGRALAETTPRGDIVHYVSSDSETLAQLAKWYTGNEMTLSRIARANNFLIDRVLTTGDQVIIPSELVKNKYIPNDSDFTNVTE